VSGAGLPSPACTQPALGFVQAYSNSLYALAVEKYPSDNCAMVYPNGGFQYHAPQDVFSSFLTHAAGQAIVAPYLNSAGIAQTAGKPFLMFETNTVFSRLHPSLIARNSLYF
jgi:hypothetical protein